MTVSSAILTEDDVRTIRRLLWKGELTQDEIGTKYGVDQRTISAIKTGRRWPHIKWPNGKRGRIPAYKAREILLLRQKQSKEASKSAKET